MVTNDLEDIILNAMMKEPSQRPQSANEFADMLEDYLSVEEENTLTTVSFREVKNKRRDKKVNIRKRNKLTITPKSVKRMAEIRERRPVVQKNNLPWYIAGGVGGALALVFLGHSLFSGNENNNTAVKPPVVKKDYSNIDNMDESLERRYSYQLHQDLVDAVKEIPKKTEKDLINILRMHMNLKTSLT